MFLLIWAFMKPIERRFIALLTIVVLIGLISTTITSMFLGLIGANYAIYTLVIQVVIISLFILGYITTHGTAEKALWIRRIEKALLG